MSLEPRNKRLLLVGIMTLIGFLILYYQLLETHDQTQTKLTTLRHPTAEKAKDQLTQILNTINDPGIILTFVSGDYMKIFDIFYKQIIPFNLSNLLVISTDKTAEQVLSSNKYSGIRSMLLEFKINSYISIGQHKKNNEFWQYRFNSTARIFEISKKGILHADLDALWMKDFWNLLQIYDEASKYDLYASQVGSKGWPNGIAKKYGFVHCNGFFYYKYNEKTKHIFQDMNTEVNEGNDQIKTNQYLFKHAQRIIQNVENDSLIDKAIYLDNGIKVGFLKQDIVSRGKCKNAYVWHPLVRGSVKSRIREIQRKYDCGK